MLRSLCSERFERGVVWAELTDWQAPPAVGQPGFELPTCMLAVGNITIGPSLFLILITFRATRSILTQGLENLFL